jgi:hypothetical protein
MKNKLEVGAAILLIGLTTTFAAAQSGNTDRDRLAGAWKLIALEQPGPDGKLNRIDCCGIFVFARDGHLSVQIMERKPRPQSAVAGSEQYSQGGYEASYGTFTVDERTHTFIFHVEGSLVRTLIGKDLPRSYEFAGSRLIVKSARPEEHWQAIWQHY